jgi:hypothetical protein
MIVRAYPIRVTVKDVERFATALRDKPSETAAFYTGFGVTHESWHVQQAGTGWQLISVTVVDDSQRAAQAYATASTEFESWFKAQVLHLTGLDPNEQPLGPPSTQVFEWHPAGEGPSRSPRAV